MLYKTFGVSNYFWQIELNDPANLGQSQSSHATVSIYNADGFLLEETYTFAEHCPGS